MRRRRTTTALMPTMSSDRSLSKSIGGDVFFQQFDVGRMPNWRRQRRQCTAGTLGANRLAAATLPDSV
jgi:hypothetical protein